ncbi:MAG: tripartite tricarboxylate transporter substrate binding protein [Spirochaetales bacterium]|jgi:tripartite-type tricarboxylate transporter receptor subunit TctC|nr:tripartite tricarboxylate transporter substrate binding protein [Spirochaetales bacterium]
MKKILAILLTLLVSAALFTGCGSKGADPNFPEKPVQCIIPYAPGGGSDVLTRAIMKDLKMAQPLVAVNIEGGSGLVGAYQVFDAKADGYTILAHNPVDLIGFDLGGLSDEPLWDELETLAMVVADYNVISTNKFSDWKTIEDVVAWTKANPGQKIKWAVSGARSVNMADTQRIAQALGIFDNITFVPYDGGAGTRKALLGDEARLETTTASEIKALVASGDNIPLLVVSGERIKSQPDLPSTLEKGIDVTTVKWRGYYAPKGTPRAVMDYLENALKEVATNPAFVDFVENNLNFTANFVGGAAAKQQIVKWTEELRPFFEDLK